MTRLEEIEKCVRPVLEEKGFELVESTFLKEHGKWVLRLFVDKLGFSGAVEQPDEILNSVTLGDCEQVSDWAGKALDASVLANEGYILEVSSPGINRALKTEAHFLRFIGKKAKLSLHDFLSETTRQRNFTGILLSCENGEVEIDDVVSGRVKVPFQSIAKAHLDLI